MTQDIENLILHLPDDIISIGVRLNGDADEALALVRRIIDASVVHLGLESAKLNDLYLATTEACTNVIRHAYHHDESKFFDVEFKVCTDFIMIELLYNDPGFDPDKIPVPNLMETERKEGGLGVFLMKQLMNYVKYTTDTVSGDVSLKMVKLFRS